MMGQQCRVFLMRYISFCLLVSATCYAQQQPMSVDDLFSKAILEVKNNTSGDFSSAERMFLATLERDPMHPKAMWQLTFRRLNLFEGGVGQLPYRASNLAKAGPIIKAIVEYAEARGEMAFSYYVQGRYAGLHNNFKRAIVEMDKALSIEPDSVRYRYIKGSILIDKGEWENDDLTINKGITLIDEARKSAEHSPTIYLTPANFYFTLAMSNSKLRSEDPLKTIEYYNAYLKHKASNISKAHAWNNISIAYRVMGECDKATEAASQALELAKFRAAQTNLRYAEFCQEMKALGIAIAKGEK